MRWDKEKKAYFINPSATSAPQTVPWIYQYTVYFRAIVRATDSCTNLSQIKNQ